MELDGALHPLVSELTIVDPAYSILLFGIPPYAIAQGRSETVGDSRYSNLA